MTTAYIDEVAWRAGDESRQAPCLHHTNDKMRSRSLSCALAAMLAACFASRVVFAQNQQPRPQQTAKQDARIPIAQLVAPIVTYPHEIVQMHRWTLVDSVSQHSWNPNVQSLTALPDVFDRVARARDRGLRPECVAEAQNMW